MNIHNSSLIPTIYKHIYRSKVDDFLVLYNPYSIKGIALVDKRKAKLFDKLDGKKRLKDYLLLAKKLNINKDEFSHFISTLLNHEVINFEGKTDINLIAAPPTKKLVILWLYLNNQCNFRCTYCFVDKLTKRMNESTLTTFINKLSPLKEKYRFEKINLTLAGGEPLLEFGLIKKIVTRTKELRTNDYLSITIVTNGSLLTEEMAKYFKENRITVAISLDGIGKYNDRTRIFTDGSGTFKHIKKGIDIALKYKIIYGICTTLTSKNIDGLIDLAKFCLKNNIKITPWFYRKVNQTCNEKLFTNFEKIINIYKKFLETVYIYYERNKIPRSPLFDNDYLELRNIQLSMSEFNCGAGRNYFSISTDGTVSFCPSSEIKIASLKNKNFVLKAQKACVPLWEEMSVNKINECQSCLWKYICAGGCMLERLYLDKTKPSYKCEVYKALIPFILNLEARRIVKKTLSSL